MLQLLFVYIIIALGLACLLVSILTWKDNSRSTPGPGYWTIGFALFTISILLFAVDVPPALDFVRILVLYAAISLQLIGFARFHGQIQRWPLSPIVVLACVLACLSAFPVFGHQQWKHLVMYIFFVFMMTGGTIHLLRLKATQPDLPLPEMLVALFQLTSLGMVRFVLALIGADPDFWFNGGMGDYILDMTMLVQMVVLSLWQLRMVNKRLNIRIGGMDHELANSQRHILLTLAEVIERSSHETGGHVYRVGRYTHTLARILGWSEQDARHLAEAAHLHDIGKISIPDRILDKPGPLSTAEFITIKTHTTIGHGILSRSDKAFFSLAALIALEHHENWNGTGYPEGKVGTEISLPGRIVALCDVFDALSHQRSYKEAWSLNRIFNYLQEERGKKFDPELVDIVMENRGLFTGIAYERPNYEHYEMVPGSYAPA